MWEELLGEGEGDWRGDPGNLHDGEETSAPGGVHLVEGAGAGDDSHHAEVYGVLDWSDLFLLAPIHKMLGFGDSLQISC